MEDDKEIAKEIEKTDLAALHNAESMGIGDNLVSSDERKDDLQVHGLDH